jgi:hypothetical protein
LHPIFAVFLGFYLEAIMHEIAMEIGEMGVLVNVHYTLEPEIIGDTEGDVYAHVDAVFVQGVDIFGCLTAKQVEHIASSILVSLKDLANGDLCEV